MKNQYGVTPWGSWFIDVLNSYRMGERLERGRRYANAGRVLSLEINEGGAAGSSVIAKVEGNYRPFYRVEITFPDLKQKEEVYKLIENDPPLLAQIASGELPESFLKKLKNKGINLIPVRWHDMKRSCNCPDYGDPCKHMAALYYIIAKEIDADPHILFRLRGLNLKERFGQSAVHTIEPPFRIFYADEHAKKKNVTVATDLNLESIPHCGELISTLLPPSPPFCTKDFSQIMAEVYHYFNLSQEDYIDWEDAEGESITDIEHNYSRSAWKVICKNIECGADLHLQMTDINGNKKLLSLYEAFTNFRQFSSDDGTASYTFLFYLFKYLNLICSSGAFIPFVLLQDKSLKIIWRPFVTLPDVKKILNSIAALDGASGIFTVNVPENSGNDSKRKQTKKIIAKTITGQSTVDLLASSFLQEWIRRNFLIFRSALLKYGAGEDVRMLLNLFFQGFSVDVTEPALHSLPAAIDRWLSVLHIQFDKPPQTAGTDNEPGHTEFTGAYHFSFTVKAHKVPNLFDTQYTPDGKAHTKDAAAKKNFNEEFRFTLSMEVLTETPDESETIKKTQLCKCRDLDVLRAPTALSNYLPEIRDLFKKPQVELSEARLVAFLDSASVLLTRLGITITLPKALHRELKPRLVVKNNSKSGSLVKYLDMETLQDFEWRIAIGDQILTADEFRKLVNQKKAIIRFKDGFVKIDTEEFSRLLKKAKDAAPDYNDFIKAHLQGDSVLAFDARETINNLFKERNFAIPKKLNAELRPYQITGYNWICSLLLSGFGCILADDMGLGKTIQSITSILRFKEEKLLSKGCLVIAPASLLINWENELERFAPSLKVARYHGNRRKLDRKSDVFLTTYQTAVRDCVKLKEEVFSMLLVDEAHLMKNSDTRISKTVKQLRSQYRLALSGTPVENRLEDLRSLFDFILPGYLGTQESFKKQYRIPIEVMRNAEQAESLRKITQPFLLRRVKTDKSIIKDLPDKIVINEYAVLEKEQAALYENIVSDSIKKAEKLEPKDRSALILNMLTSLKQICDHPRVFDKESPAVSGLSGKAQLLLTLLQEILNNREKTLVFSQYVETLDCLERIIKKELKEAPLIFHGGLNQNIRNEIINKFQNDPACRILLVSLKAGGLGLNLTAASRVIHYDLWYNPAVENQATDRAFRIGQMRNVFVHRFITKNSFEEKIDAMITSKKELAEMTVASGESWIARMSREELRMLFERNE